MSIKKRGDKWQVTTKSGDRILGTHTSKKSALKQMAAVEISKKQRKEEQSFDRISFLEGINEMARRRIEIMNEMEAPPLKSIKGWSQGTPDIRHLPSPYDIRKLEGPVSGPGGITYYPDGSWEITDEYGITIRYYPDGTEYWTYPDGSWSITEEQPDGSIRTIYSDGSWRIIEEGSDGSITITYSDGTVSVEYPGGTVIVTDPDGTVTVYRPDGTEEVRAPDGTVTLTQPDGTIIITQPDGTVTVNRPDGNVEVHYPDGSVTVTHPDGGVFAFPPPTFDDHNGDGVYGWGWTVPPYGFYTYPDGITEPFDPNDYHVPVIPHDPYYDDPIYDA